ncbi:glycoside hydrolase family 2 [Candidatus Desantisbacteria bacterium CG02_land_8_20_14_3_00_49_13]|nr:MAG: glycoside hydrolase family 2 [Candidatus Desantisbacteria bacterium CG02_land_8_20_14_3_00_49_13]
MVPRPEYPRPQFVRKEWLNLNGEWEFEFDDAPARLEGKWQGKKIIVPFPFQSKLSGVSDVSFHDVVWYARNFTVPEKWEGKEILLHFGAVDYECWVWINGREISTHKGGNVPFYLNITKYLKPGENKLMVRVEDKQDPFQPRGKQVVALKPEGCDYDRTTGIWQTVWLEPVPRTRIEYFKIKTEIDFGKDSSKVKGQGSRVKTQKPDCKLKIVNCKLQIVTTGWRPGQEIEVCVYYKGKTVAKRSVELENGCAALDIPVRNPKLWSPEAPNIYDCKLSLRDPVRQIANCKGEIIDEIETYFGIRTVSVKGNRVLLNNKPYYLKLVLDQGYFPESLLALPSDEAVKKDIEFTKAFGFNGCRKHQKVDDPRFYYWADKLGLIVWGEMANARPWSKAGEGIFLHEWPKAVKRDINHPCIIAWVPFNESWGVPELGKDTRQQEFVKKVVRLTREMDPTRLVVDNDGWEHVDTDLVTIHDYSLHASDYEKNYAQFRKDNKTLPAVHRPAYAEGYEYDGKPILITEYGGIGYKLPGRQYAEKDWGYHNPETEEAKVIARFKEVTEAIFDLDFCCGFCYTQLTDIQQEINGVLTFDRVPKVDPKKIARILNQK